jgi:hypothetical protein
MSSSFEPHYPLTREQFRHALHAGLGRAALHVARFGAAEFQDDILEAATVCKTLDPQVEGVVAEWLAPIVVEAGLVPEIVARPPTGTDWDRELRCALLLQFALLGYPSARDGLYQACEPAENSADVYGCAEIVELDGEKGLVFVARLLGELLVTRPGFWVDDELSRLYDERHGEGSAMAALGKFVPHDAAIVRYLDGVVATSAQRSEHAPRARRSAKNVVAAIEKANGPLDWVRHWGSKATLHELEPVLRLAIPASAPLVLENALRCLSGSRTLPLQPQLFAFLDHESDGVRKFAALALAQHVDPRVRAAGLAALSRDLRVALTLLCKNASSVDGTAIAEVLRPFADEHVQHAVTSDLIELLEQSQAVREPSIALYVYEHAACRRCRADAVGFLIHWNASPRWLLEEGAHDASAEIRKACSTALAAT